MLGKDTVFSKVKQTAIESSGPQIGDQIASPSGEVQAITLACSRRVQA